MSYIDPRFTQSPISMFTGLVSDAAGSAGSTLSTVLKRLSAKAPVTTAAPVVVPGSTGIAHTMQKNGIAPGNNGIKTDKRADLLGNIGSGVSILGDLAGIYQGFQANKLAKQEFGANRAFANANLENTVKSYNTRLADIYRARGYTQGDDTAATQAAITANSLNFKRI